MTSQKIAALIMARLGGVKIEDVAMHLECESVLFNHFKRIFV